MKIVIIDADNSELGGASRSLIKIKKELEVFREILIFNLNLKVNSKNRINKFYESYIFFLLKELLKFFYDFLKIHKEISDLKKKINNQNAIFLVKNYRLIPYLKFFFKKNRIIFLCSGFAITDYFSKKNKNIAKIIKIRKFCFSPYEMFSIYLSNKVISNSLINKEVIKSNFKINNNINIIYTSELLETDLLKNTNKTRIKEFDLIFVSSDLNRNEKNFEFIKKIFNDSQTVNLKKIVISSFDNGNNDRYQFLNYTNKINFFDTLQKTKIILIPSKFDSSPNVFYEAIFNNCIPIISHTCGVRHFDDDLILDSFEISRWIKNINNVVIDYKKYQTKLFDMKKKLVLRHSDIINELKDIILNE